MALDASIYSQLQPGVKLNDPLAQAAQLSQIQALQNQNQLFPIQLQSAQIANSKAQQNQAFAQRFLNKLAPSQDPASTAGAPAAGSAPSSGTNMLAPQGSQGGSNLGGLSLNDLQGAAVLGIPGAKELFDMFKYQNDGIERKPGSMYKDPVTGAMTYTPDVSKGVDYDPVTKTVSTLNGAPAALSAVAGATKTAETQAVNNNTLAPLDRIDPTTGRPYVATVGQLVQAAGGGQPVQGAAPQPAPAASAPSTQPAQGGYVAPTVGQDGHPIPVPLQQHLTTLAQSRDPAQLQAFGQQMQGKIAQMPEGPQKQAAMTNVQAELDKIQSSWQTQPAPAASAPATQPGGFNGFQSPAESAAAVDQAKATVATANAGQQAYAKGSNEGAVDYEKGLNARVQAGQDLMMRLQESRDALTKFSSGGGTEARTKIASLAQAFGAPQAMVDKIAGGDLGAAQEFQKLAAQQAMETLKSSLGNGGRITQAEFKVFQQNNPNLDTDPRAIEKVYNFASKVYGRDQAEQDALNKYKTSGNDMSTFPNYWANQNRSNGFVTPQAVTGQAKGTQGPATTSFNVASPADYAKVPSGSTYVDPTGKVRRKP